MATTYTYADAITVAAQHNPKLQNNGFASVICDQVNSEIWNFADWRIALAKVAPFYLVPLQQDYANVPGSTVALVPPRFLGLRTAVLVYNGSEPPVHYPPLSVDRWLQPTNVQGRPTAMSYEPTVGPPDRPTGGFRLHPRPPSGIGPMDYQIEATYKMTPIKVDTTNLGRTPIPWGDHYFSVVLAGVNYFCKPEATRNRSDLEAFEVALRNMAGQEAVNLGSQVLSPREPLVGW